MSDAWFGVYASGAFFPAPRKSPPTGHTPDWWDGFSAGLTDAAGASVSQETDAGEWLASPTAVAGHLFVQLIQSAVTVDPDAVRLDRATEDCQRLLEHLGVEPAAATPSNVLPFKVRQVKGGTR